MGLDWHPGNRPKSGFEKEFFKLGKKLAAKWCFLGEWKYKRWEAISISPFEALNAPRVGYDAIATEWARNKSFQWRDDKSKTEEAYLESVKGHYVVSVLPPCDGIPIRYNSVFGKGCTFRGDYLKECEAVIGYDLLQSAFVSKKAVECFSYGTKLLDCAREYSEKHSIKLGDIPPDEGDGTPVNKMDIVCLAAKWCRFWGERGHGLVVDW